MVDFYAKVSLYMYSINVLIKLYGKDMILHYISSWKDLVFKQNLYNRINRIKIFKKVICPFHSPTSMSLTWTSSLYILIDRIN